MTDILEKIIAHKQAEIKQQKALVSKKELINNCHQLDYIGRHVDMAGVNNRNLGTFHTDVENSFRLAEKLPGDVLWVSESGISRPETVSQLRNAGFRGFLIGEHFMRTTHPGNALHDFITRLSPEHTGKQPLSTGKSEEHAQHAVKQIHA